MSHYVFSFISFSFICNVCNVWMLYKRERERERERETEKWGTSVNSEEEMREKNEMGEGGCKYVVGEKKKKRQGVHGWWGKKKKKWGVGFTCMVEKKGSRKERRKKNLKGQKLNWFYLYVHFVWCQV